MCLCTPEHRARAPCRSSLCGGISLSSLLQRLDALGSRAISGGDVTAGGTEDRFCARLPHLSSPPPLSLSLSRMHARMLARASPCGLFIARACARAARTLCCAALRITRYIHIVFSSFCTLLFLPLLLGSFHLSALFAHALLVLSRLLFLRFLRFFPFSLCAHHHAVLLPSGSFFHFHFLSSAVGSFGLVG